MEYVIYVTTLDEKYYYAKCASLAEALNHFGKTALYENLKSILIAEANNGDETATIILSYYPKGDLK